MRIFLGDKWMYRGIAPLTKSILFYLGSLDYSLLDGKHPPHIDRAEMLRNIPSTFVALGLLKK